MIRATRVVRALGACLLLAGCDGGTPVRDSSIAHGDGAPGDGTLGAALPPTWSASLQLPTREALPARLARPTVDSTELALWDVRCERDGRCTPAPAHRTVTCDAYERARRDGWSARTRIDRDVLVEVGLRCAALRAVGGARTADSASLRDVRLTPVLLDALPATLGLAVTEADSARLDAAGRAGRSLRDVDAALVATVEVVPPGDTMLRAESPRQQLLVQQLGRGDFDGDGGDDLLLRVVAGAPGGSYTTQQLMVLTRRGRGPLSVVRRLW